MGLLKVSLPTLMTLVGAVGAWPHQILADQLTLPQPGPEGLGADYAHHITTCPTDFQTILWPWT